MEIIVQRGNGVNQGADIIDPLLSDLTAMLDRGRAELNEGAGLQPVQNQTLYRAGVSLGQLAEISDSFQGKNYRGKISSIAHSFSGGMLTTSITVKRQA